MARKAIFLDRDGTINKDSGYLYKIEQWQWLPFALEGLKAFQTAGYLLIVVSNQSGISRGYYSMEDLQKLEKHVEQLLLAKNIIIDAWYYCPHIQSDQCACRKPLPGMILKATADWNINLSASWLLGDRMRDIQAALFAGCRCGLIFNADYAGEAALLRGLGIPVWHNLLEAARAIL